MHWRERVSYFIFFATKGEAERGHAGRSKPYQTFSQAKEAAQTLLKNEAKSEDPIVRVEVEQRFEFFDGYHHEWCIDWDRQNGRKIIWSATL